MPLHDQRRKNECCWHHVAISPVGEGLGRRVLWDFDSGALDVTGHDLTDHRIDQAPNVSPPDPVTISVGGDEASPRSVLTALEHDSGPLLVLGGFGTGKTTVLVERFLALIGSGAAWLAFGLPSRIARARCTR